MTPISFRAMGCDVLVAGDTDPAAAVQRLFAEHERTFSRFLPDSELNRVNRSAGLPTLVSDRFGAALCAALDAARLTDGLVDPAVGAAIVAAGYDRDFELLQVDPRPAGEVAVVAAPAVTISGRVVRLGPGVTLDLNGVVKARAVDAALALLTGPGWVSAGGDLATTAAVDVALPAGGAVRLVRGGLATSGSSRRRWLRGGHLQHHLIDPRTARPAVGPWEQVTVSGASCLDADIAAKAAFLLGAEGPDWLDDRDLPGRFVGGGRVHENRSWAQALGAEVACI